MPSTNIWQLAETHEQVQNYYYAEYSRHVPNNLTIIFNIAMANKDLFPDMNLAREATYRDFVDRWVRNYLNADNNPIRNRTASPKGSCNDPAVKAIVRIVTQVSIEKATIQESYHNLFMSAENVQGALLEEYIDSIISNYNWVWCKGNTLRSVDFCTIDGSRLLQIKNKSNSENSSSSNIRSGTRIEKWYRLGTKTVAGKKIPDYKWDCLNDIIDSASWKPCNLCEEGYVEYIERVAVNNPSLITDK